MQQSARIIVVSLLIITGVLYFWITGSTSFSLETQEVAVVQKWELPDILEEVSGIVYLEGNKIAAVQDEKGIIFIYNLKTSVIDRQINFGEDGDYEALTIAENTAYVLRSDGTIFEVQNFRTNGLKAIEHPTFLSSKDDTEGLAYDATNNRLLISVKDKVLGNTKPVYEFDLETKSLKKEPAFKIDLDNTIFEEVKQRKTRHRLKPSEITIHPHTGNIYILEGVNPKLLILDNKGIPLKIHYLNKDQFRQAEGITFSRAGEMFISNEARDEVANILKIRLED